MNVVEVRAPVVSEVDGALTEEAPPRDCDEARSSRVPSRATKLKDVTRRSRSRTKGKNTLNSSRRRSDSSTIWKSLDTVLSDDDGSTGYALGLKNEGAKKRHFGWRHRTAQDYRRKPTD